MTTPCTGATLLQWQLFVPLILIPAKFCDCSLHSCNSKWCRGRTVGGHGPFCTFSPLLLVPLLGPHLYTQTLHTHTHTHTHTELPDMPYQHLFAFFKKCKLTTFFFLGDQARHLGPNLDLNTEIKVNYYFYSLLLLCASLFGYSSMINEVNQSTRFFLHHDITVLHGCLLELLSMIDL